LRGGAGMRRNTGRTDPRGGPGASAYSPIPIAAMTTAPQTIAGMSQLGRACRGVVWVTREWWPGVEAAATDASLAGP